MRTKVKVTILGSALALSLALNASLAIGTIWVESASGRRPSAPGPSRPGCLLNGLELDAGQRARLSELREAMSDKRATYHRRAGAIKAELAGAICAPDSSRRQIDVLLRRYSRAQAEMQRAVADHLLRVKAMLTPGQREEFRSLLRTQMFRGIRSTPAPAAGRP